MEEEGRAFSPQGRELNSLHEILSVTPRDICDSTATTFTEIFSQEKLRKAPY